MAIGSPPDRRGRPRTLTGDRCACLGATIRTSRLIETDRAAWDSLLREARAGVSPVVGFHHHNYPVPLPETLADRTGLPRGSKVTLRLRRPPREVLDVTLRTWPEEGAVLRAVQPWLPNVPRSVARTSRYSVHTYAPGLTLSDVSPPGKPLEPECLDKLGPIFAALLRVPVDVLPATPADWPSDGDSAGFLRRLTRFTERVRRTHQGEFGALFDQLAVPADGMARLWESLPPLTDRPYALLHSDLHRGNIVVRDDGELHVIDWELATLGDPLYELATHLCRMDYPSPGQWDDAIEVWRAAADAVDPRFTRGMDTDLETYLRYERGQSVYPDTMRAARAMIAPTTPLPAAQAALTVHTALERAATPLRMPRVPTLPDVESALRTWRRTRLAAARAWGMYRDA